MTKQPARFNGHSELRTSPRANSVAWTIVDSSKRTSTKHPGSRRINNRDVDLLLSDTSDSPTGYRYLAIFLHLRPAQSIKTHSRSCRHAVTKNHSTAESTLTTQHWLYTKAWTLFNNMNFTQILHIHFNPLFITPALSVSYHFSIFKCLRDWRIYWSRNKEIVIIIFYASFTVFVLMFKALHPVYLENQVTLRLLATVDDVRMTVVR